MGRPVDYVPGTRPLCTPGPRGGHPFHRIPGCPKSVLLCDWLLPTVQTVPEEEPAQAGIDSHPCGVRRLRA